MSLGRRFDIDRRAGLDVTYMEFGLSRIPESDGAEELQPRRRMCRMRGDGHTFDSQGDGV